MSGTTHSAKATSDDAAFGADPEHGSRRIAARRRGMPTKLAAIAAIGVALTATGCASGDTGSVRGDNATGTASGNEAATATVRPPDPGKPTIVLLHGAFEDASSWSGVTRRLQADGYPVVAPAIPLTGVASDTASARAVVATIAGPKVLVGHSYGGLLVSELASTTTGVTAQVYVAAFIPAAGESGAQLTAQFPGSLLGPATTHTVTGPAGPEVYVNTANFAEVVTGGTPTVESQIAAVGQRPILAKALEEKVTHTAPSSIPAYAVVATEDKAIPPAEERFLSQRAHAAITELPAPHAVAGAKPDAVAEVIERAAGPR